MILHGIEFREMDGWPVITDMMIMQDPKLREFIEKNRSHFCRSYHTMVWVFCDPKVLDSEQGGDNAQNP